jgi:hypothetical protein
VFLLWASFVLMFPGAIYDAFHPDPDMTQGEMLLFVVFYMGATGAISYWLNTAAWKGRNYGRWVLAALTLFGVSLYFWDQEIFDEIQSWPWYIQSTDYLGGAVAIVGNIMLFAPSANAWYRAKRASR